MAKGGHARSGPAPDLNALRRDRDQKEWTDLPRAGRDGAAPVWPLPDVRANELGMWEREWRRPQAIMWEAAGQELEVALFVRAVTVAQGDRATAADRNVVQRKMTDLGLTTPGIRANRWRIVDHVQEATAGRTRIPGKSSTRDRLKVLEGGA